MAKQSQEKRKGPWDRIMNSMASLSQCRLLCTMYVYVGYLYAAMSTASIAL